MEKLEWATKKNLRGKRQEHNIPTEILKYMTKASIRMPLEIINII